MKLKDFLAENATRPIHNDGSKLAISEDQFLIVMGPDSDVGREIAMEKYRLNPDDQEFSERLRGLYARLVKSWSFDEPLTLELVDELLKEYPIVYDKVITHFGNRANFTKG